jgi:glycosyltransferase involved in cell wall biosynthesis
VVIIARNEEKDIKECFASATWADEIILIDGGSTDKTLEIAAQFPVKVVRQKVQEMDYAAWHNQGIGEAGHQWLFYLDADERFTPDLKKEIKEIIRKTKTEYSAYAVPRRNFLLGKELHYGGWYPDYQIRLFKKSQLKKWVGPLHERPIFNGELGYLKGPMIHIQPETIEPMLQKSIKWSATEAKRLLEANHPPVVWWRILRMGATTLFDRLIKKQGFRDGTEGWIESIYQAFHTMIVYIRLWEMQREGNANKNIAS